MATLKEFEEALLQQGMTTALGILESLRSRDRAKRRAAPARRVTGRKMTPEVARRILELHGSTPMTQQEIAFKLGVNQGRVNEVIKRGKWLDGDPASSGARSGDQATAKAGPRQRLTVHKRPAPTKTRPIAAPPPKSPVERGQLSFGGL